MDARSGHRVQCQFTDLCLLTDVVLYKLVFCDNQLTRMRNHSSDWMAHIAVRIEHPIAFQCFNVALVK